MTTKRKYVKNERYNKLKKENKDLRYSLRQAESYIKQLEL